MFHHDRKLILRKKMFQHGSYKLKKGGLSNNDGNSSENITFAKSEFVFA